MNCSSFKKGTVMKSLNLSLHTFSDSGLKVKTFLKLCKSLIIKIIIMRKKKKNHEK